MFETGTEMDPEQLSALECLFPALHCFSSCRNKSFSLLCAEGGSGPGWSFAVGTLGAAATPKSGIKETFVFPSSCGSPNKVNVHFWVAGKGSGG